VGLEAQTPAGSRGPGRPPTLPTKKKLTGSTSIPGTPSDKSGVDMSPQSTPCDALAGAWTLYIVALSCLGPPNMVYRGD